MGFSTLTLAVEEYRSRTVPVEEDRWRAGELPGEAGVMCLVNGYITLHTQSLFCGMSAYSLTFKCVLSKHLSLHGTHTKLPQTWTPTLSSA